MRDDEKKQVGDFLEFVISNKAINVLLYKKKGKTKAEEFLCSLSHCTKETSSCSETLEKIATIEEQLQEVQDRYDICVEDESKIFKYLDDNQIPAIPGSNFLKKLQRQNLIKRVIFTTLFSQRALLGDTCAVHR